MRFSTFRLIDQPHRCDAVIISRMWPASAPITRSDREPEAPQGAFLRITYIVGGVPCRSSNRPCRLRRGAETLDVPVPGRPPASPPDRDSGLAVPGETARRGLCVDLGDDEVYASVERFGGSIEVVKGRATFGACVGGRDA